MSWPVPVLADVLRARGVIAPYLRPTPTIESAALGELLGCRVYLKCEHLNPTCAFKVRGGVNLIGSRPQAHYAGDDQIIVGRVVVVVTARLELALLHRQGTGPPFTGLRVEVLVDERDHGSVWAPQGLASGVGQEGLEVVGH